MVCLILIAQPAKDLDRLRYSRLFDIDGRKPPFERGILFNILAVFVDGGRADGLQLPARQHGL